MNRKILSLLMASALTVSTSITTFAAPAEPTGDKPATEQTGGPVIKVKQSAFLVQVGQKFDLSKSLGLEVTDPTDGNITDQVKLPAVPTDKVNKFTIKIPVTDSKGLQAEKTITVNVIEIAKTMKLDKMSDLQKYDLKKLITGNLEGLTVTATNINNDKGSFDLVVSDGTNKLTQPITVQLATVTPKDETEGNVNDSIKADQPSNGGSTTTDDNGAGAEKTTPVGKDASGTDPSYEGMGSTTKTSATGDKTSTTSNSLPKTGVLPIGGGLGIAGTIALGAGVVYLKKRR